MMRVLKNILLVLTLCLFTSSVGPGLIEKESVNTDVVEYSETTTYGGYETEVYIPWKKSGSGYWLQYSGYYVYNDFSFMISRSKEKIGGYYYYDIWFYSESYYWDGKNAEYTSTNIKNVYVYVDGKLTTYNESSIGITFFNETTPHSLRFVTTSKYPKVWVQWKQMKAI
jgi:hypothetical protein